MLDLSAPATRDVHDAFSHASSPVPGLRVTELAGPDAELPAATPALPAPREGEPAETRAAGEYARPQAEGRASTTVTLYDVARLAGVSTATVSRVVHGLDRVRDTTRARVLEVREQLGYGPDARAQS